MDSDPSGQLGGLETPAAVRKRHAAASRDFKCITCGKTNLEIIQECEEAAKAAAGSSDASDEKVEVPPELKMGWKDELGQNKSEKGQAEKAAAAQPSPSPKESGEDTETAELAEGFVSTGNAPAAAAQLSPQAVPSPTSTTPVSTPVATTTHPASPAQRPTADAVPVWIDRLIVAIVVLLAALIARLVMQE